MRIWQHLNNWIRRKLIETITTDGSGNTAIRIVGSIVLGSKGTPNILNVDAVNVNQEYLITIPAEAKSYKLRNRGNAKIQYAFTSGDTNTTFFTLMPGNIENEDFLKRTTNLNIYFETTKPNQTIEVLYWT